MQFEVKRKRPRVEIVPMIDVIFFLLIFFFLFSNLNEAQTGVEVDLPQTLHLGQVEQNLVVISIRDNNEVFFGKNPVPLEGLAEHVRNELEKDVQTRFIVRPDATVSYQRIIQVTDILAGEGIDKPLWGVDRHQIPNIIR